MINLILNKLPLFLILILISACTTTKPLPDKIVNHTYNNIEFTPNFYSAKIEDNFTLTVTPIDASAINEITFLAAYRSGDYEEEIVSEYLDSKNDRRLSSTEERYFENLVKVSNEIISDMNSNNLPEELALSLLERSWQGISKGMDGSELSSSSELMQTADFNPYYINNNYLSVFKLTFENQSNEVKQVQHERFQLAIGNEILYPFSIENFEDRLKDEDIKLVNAYRFNLPNNMNIAPGQTIERYISVPAISRGTTYLALQYFKPDNDVVKYEFNVDQIREVDRVRFVNFIIDPLTSSENLRYSDFFYAIRLESGNTFPLKANNFYVPSDSINQTVQICKIQVSGHYIVESNYRYTIESYYNCMNVKLSDYENQVISVDFSK